MASYFLSKERLIKASDNIINCGILAIIFFTPLIVDFSLTSYNFFDLYKAVFFRLVLSLIFLAYAAKIFIQEKITFKGGNKIFWLTSVLLLSFFISSFFSVHPNDSFWGSFQRQQGFYNFFHYLLFFILVVLNLKDFKFARKMVFAAAASASLTAVYGLAQYLRLDFFNWGEAVVNSDRIFSTLGQPNFFGHFLLLTLPLTLYCLIFLAKTYLGKFIAALSALAQLFCLIFTYSRAAWLGFLGAIFLFLFFWLLSKRLKKTALTVSILLVIGLSAVIAVNLTDKPFAKGPATMDVIYRFKTIADFRGGSSKMRLYYIKSAWEEIKSRDNLRLWLGNGPETLAGIYFKYYQPDWGVYETVNTVPDRAHNWLFDQILSLGLLGLLANLAFYGFIVYKAAGFVFKKLKLSEEDWLAIFLFASLTAYSINNFFSFSLFTVMVYLYFILALVWFVINREEAEEVIDLRLTKASKLLIWLSLLACLSVFLYTNNFNQARAEIYYVKALRSFKAADCRVVTDNLNRAVELSPNNNFFQENYLFLTLNCLAKINDPAGRLELGNEMLSFIEQIGDRGYYGLQANLARAYTLFGLYLDKIYFAKAEIIYNGLISAYPRVDTYYEDLGRQYDWQGDYARAIELYQRAISVLPPADHPDLNAEHRGQIAAERGRLYEALGKILVKTGDYASAAVYFEKALNFDPYRATLYKDLADTYYLRGDLERALALNRRGWMLNPNDYHWPLSLSLLCRDKRDLVKAKDYLDQALRLAPEDQGLIKYGEELVK